MTSEKQRAANKRNAQTSSGPTSAEGKAASRMNALKSGLYAKSAVIRGESTKISTNSSSSTTTSTIPSPRKPVPSSIP